MSEQQTKAKLIISFVCIISMYELELLDMAADIKTKRKSGF